MKSKNVREVQTQGGNFSENYAYWAYAEVKRGDYARQAQSTFPWLYRSLNLAEVLNGSGQLRTLPCLSIFVPCILRSPISPSIFFLCSVDESAV
ncbi:hypothetical protein Nepgr_001626 [Nepenthes gracilis]|uniref:Uncharacterized protein n=1 Tax=Nepenthes gracilis TaxID=150966 RepID=A0AAD3P5H5_NEPGR|nr:hypothetical protein Nepgr_001626 [Nepenthes gracilis]